MSLIKNLVKEPEKNENKSNTNNDGNDNKNMRPIIKSALDLQRLKLEKLMKNPDKQVVIPEARKEKDYMQSVPSFVRNVMGSSAGAGSGEFHVYRHLRRKEYARQKMIQNKSAKELLDEEYQKKLDDNRRIAEEKTAKKRAKRLKKRKKQTKVPKLQTEDQLPNDESSSSDDADVPDEESNLKLSLSEKEEPSLNSKREDTQHIEDKA